MSGLRIPDDRPGVRFFRKSIGLLVNLAARWREEHEYESIGDYLEPFRATAAECGVTLERMTARPFGVKFNDGGLAWHAVVCRGGVELRRYT